MASTQGEGRGRAEARSIATTTWLNEYRPGWPRLARACRLERTRTVRGVTATEVVYGLTSLPRGRATAADVLALCRAHRAIENGLHYVRDETFRGGRCRVRVGQSPRVPASLRNVAIHLLKGRGGRDARTRRPHEAAAMITTPA